MWKIDGKDIFCNKDSLVTMNESGLAVGQKMIISYFNQSLTFGSLFILADQEEEKRIVCEIKVINEGLGQISFVPLGEDELLFIEGETVYFINETNNISFKATALKNHNRSWLTLKMPEEVKVVNLRQSKRIILGEEVLDTPAKITSYGEDGVRALMENNGDCIDISETGAAFEIKASRIDGYYKGDHVELNISHKYSFLSNIRGKVVHKTLANMMDKENRKYRIGIKFNKSLDLSIIQQV
jgi:hypothetical protein